MLLSLSNSLPFAWISLVKLGKNSKNSYFSDFEPIFLLFGGVCSKSDFSKKKIFLREGFFETNLDLNKHPQQVFWFFWAFFSNFFSKKNNHYILEELRQLCSKFHNFSMKIRGETRVESWTFLALFFRKRIVQWVVWTGLVPQLMKQNMATLIWTWWSISGTLKFYLSHCNN